MTPRDIWLIARFELARHLRSRHALFAAVLLVLFCGVSAYQLAMFAEEVGEFSRELGPGLDLAMGWIQGATGLPAVGVAALVEDHPPLLVLLFGMILTLMPLLTIVLAYDQTATEIETRHVRYRLFRVRREAIYLGKALGALLFVGAAVALVLVVFGVFLVVYADGLGGLGGLLYLVRMWLTALLYALPFVAFLGLMSALIGRARRSFSVSILAWIGLSAAAGIATLADERFEFLRFAFPATRDRYTLMLDSFADASDQIVYVLVYTVVVGGLGLWRFRTRDL